MKQNYRRGDSLFIILELQNSFFVQSCTITLFWVEKEEVLKMKDIILDQTSIITSLQNRVDSLEEQVLYHMANSRINKMIEKI